MKFTAALLGLVATAPALLCEFQTSLLGEALAWALGAEAALCMALLGVWLACLWVASLLVESTVGRVLGLRAAGGAA